MRRPSWLLLLLLAAGAAAAFYRLRNPRRREMVDLYFDDGSLATYGEDDPDGVSMLTLARAVRHAASSR